MTHRLSCAWVLDVTAACDCGAERPPSELLKFSDDRIDEVRQGAPLTPRERAYLIENTPTFEECSQTSEDLANLSDAELMTAAMWVWHDYCR